MHLHISYQKLSALSASLARTVPSVEDEEAELDHFPAEGVSDRQNTCSDLQKWPLVNTRDITYWETFCS